MGGVYRARDAKLGRDVLREVESLNERIKEYDRRRRRGIA
jgi:hypothetical protein